MLRQMVGEHVDLAVSVANLSLGGSGGSTGTSAAALLGGSPLASMAHLLCVQVGAM